MITNDKNGLWYSDGKVELYFPIIYRGFGETLQSPITGYPIRNREHLNYHDLIERHISKQRKVVSKPHWLTYVEAKKYYGNIEYKEFIKTKFTEYMNMGYSKRLLSIQNISK